MFLLLFLYPFPNSSIFLTQFLFLSTISGPFLLLLFDPFRTADRFCTLNGLLLAEPWDDEAVSDNRRALPRHQRLQTGLYSPD
jgi:hypothetical protein